MFPCQVLVLQFSKFSILLIWDAEFGKGVSMYKHKVGILKNPHHIWDTELHVNTLWDEKIMNSCACGFYFLALFKSSYISDPYLLPLLWKCYKWLFTESLPAVSSTLIRQSLLSAQFMRASQIYFVCSSETVPANEAIWWLKLICLVFTGENVFIIKSFEFHWLAPKVQNGDVFGGEKSACWEIPCQVLPWILYHRVISA